MGFELEKLVSSAVDFTTTLPQLYEARVYAKYLKFYLAQKLQDRNYGFHRNCLSLAFLTIIQDIF